MQAASPNGKKLHAIHRRKRRFMHHLGLRPNAKIASQLKPLFMQAGCASVHKKLKSAFSRKSINLRPSKFPYNSLPSKYQNNGRN